MPDAIVTQTAQTLRPHERVKSGADFKKIYAARQSLRAFGLTIAYLSNGLNYSRLGLSVSSKHGNAVRRNRIKRTLRAAFRELKNQIPVGYDFVLIPTKPPLKPTTAFWKEALMNAFKNFTLK